MSGNTSCVLCRSCANFLGDVHQERRARTRLCAAGIVQGPSAPSCDSFVPILKGTRRGRIVATSDVGKKASGP
jgi:hypothetical protein